MKNSPLKLLKPLKLVAFILIGASLFLTACGSAESEIQKTAQEPPAKKIEVFIVGEDSTPLSFTKSGQLESGSQAFIAPQTSGRITKIPVQVGDKVDKGTLLVTLGDSLSTDAAKINYQTAKEGLQKLYDTRFKTDYSAQKDIESVMLGYYSATASVENAITSKDNSEELYDEQYDSLDDTVDDLKDVIKDLKDIPNYKDTPEYKQAKSAYNQAKSQLEQMELGHKAQADQLDFAIEMAKKQLEGSILAVESVQAKLSLQFIQIDSGILQAESGADLARLQAEARNITSPISGTVTSVQAEEGNLTAPGQILITVENIEELKAKTYLSVDEINLIEEGTLTAISSSSISTTGKVSTINPTVSPNGKIEVEISLSDKKNFFSGEIIDITFTPKPDILATLVPLNSIVIEDSEYFINTITTDKTILRKQVTTGRVIGDYIEVKSGLETGDKIALSNTIFLREGDKIAYKVKR